MAKLSGKMMTIQFSSGFGVYQTFGYTHIIEIVVKEWLRLTIDCFWWKQTTIHVTRHVKVVAMRWCRLLLVRNVLGYFAFGYLKLCQDLCITIIPSYY